MVLGTDELVSNWMIMHNGRLVSTGLLIGDKTVVGKMDKGAQIPVGRVDKITGSVDRLSSRANDCP